MTPLHFAFRKLILRNIRVLNNDDIDRYEGFLGLRLELIHQRDALPGVVEPQQQTGGGPHPRRRYGPLRQQGDLRERLTRLIERTSEGAHRIFEPHRRRFAALHDLWIARRRLAVQQGGLLEIPTTFTGLKRYLAALLNYQRVRVRTFPVLAAGRVRDFFQRHGTKRILLFAAVVVLLILCFLWFLQGGVEFPEQSGVLK